MSRKNSAAIIFILALTIWLSGAYEIGAALSLVGGYLVLTDKED